MSAASAASARRGLSSGGNARPHRLDAAADRRLQRPDVAGPAKIVEAARGVIDAGRRVRNQPAERLVVLAARRHDIVNGVEETRMIELAGHAERGGEIEMADPQAIDAVD